MDSIPSTTLHLPHNWRLSSDGGNALTLRKDFEGRSLLAACATTVTMAVVAAGVARIWGAPVSKGYWVLDWTVILGAPLALWLIGLLFWSLLGNEVWHVERGAIELRRSLFGVTWVRRYVNVTLELDSNCGAGRGEAQFRLWIRQGARRVLIENGHFEDEVRRFGLLLAEESQLPLRTVR